ncbi:MAG: hypothetical protein WCB27_01760 [Thermoguttaceae bacterium]|jgi:hypothetical protein
MNRVGAVLASVIVLAGIPLCLSSVTHSEPAAKESTDGLHQMCESFVTHATRGDKDLLALFNENAPWQPATGWRKELQEATSRNQMAQLADLQRQYGAFLGYELSEQKDLSGSVRICVYIARYERNAIRWTFVCYRPHDKWKILSARFKDLLGDLFPQN